jgi:ribosomal protein S18 acetylase RimI-like enzyme
MFSLTYNSSLKAHSKTLESRLEAAALRLSVLESRLRSTGDRSTRLPLSSISISSSSHILSKLRTSNTGDLSAVKELISDSFHDVAMKHEAVKKFLKSSFAKLNDIIKAGDGYDQGQEKDKTLCIFWVVDGAQGVETKQLIGCVGLRIQFGGGKHDDAMTSIAEMLHLCVHKSCRRLGIANALMRHVIEFCRSKGVTTIQLSVLDDLIAARQFYASIGFANIKSANLGKQCILHNMVLNIS